MFQIVSFSSALRLFARLSILHLMLAGVFALGAVAIAAPAPAPAATPKAPAAQPVQTVPKLLLQTLLRPPARTGEFTVESINDPAAAAAVAEAMKKEAAIKEYYCTIELSGVADGTLTWSKGQTAFRRPDHAFEQIEVQKNPTVGMTGQKQWTVTDGKKIWQYVQNAQGSERELLAKFQAQNKGKGKKGTDKPLTSGQMKQLQNHLVPKATRYDMKRLMGAGIPLREIMGSFGIHDPWSLCDSSGVRIESETDKQWVFTSNPASANPAFNFCRITIDKQTGLARKIEMIGSVNATLMVTNARINPEPPIDDKYFQPPFPAGIEPKDSTGGLIKKYRAQDGSRAPDAPPTAIPTPDPAAQ